MLAACAQAALAGPQDFTLYNRTNVDIHAVFVAPSESEDWEEDLMNGSVLLHGADIEITFEADDDATQLWDICVQDQEGNSLYWREIDLLKAYEVILEPDGVARIKDVE